MYSSGRGGSLRLERSQDQRERETWRANVVQAKEYFTKRTGLDPNGTLPKALAATIALGLRAEADGDRSTFQGQAVTLAGPGNPGLTPKLRQAIALAVDQLGPTQAAILCLLYDLDSSRHFPVSLSMPHGSGFDFRVLQKRLKRRLHQIAEGAKQDKRLPALPMSWAKTHAVEKYEAEALVRWLPEVLDTETRSGAATCR